MIKINSNNAAVRALEAKQRLENALVAALDAGRMHEAEQLAAEMERLGWLPLPEKIVEIRMAIERVEERRGFRSNRRAERVKYRAA